MLHRRHLRGGQKGGGATGKTKRGKGTKLMVLANRSGIPLGVCVASASPHEATLVGSTLERSFLEGKLQRLVGNRVYASDLLDEQLRAEDIEMIAPHRKNRKKPKTQDGRKLRRYKRRCKVESLFEWLGNFRRLAVRYERRAENYLGLVQLG